MGALCAALLAFAPAWGQQRLSRSELEVKKKKRVQEIQKMQKMLQEIASVKSAKVNGLQLVSKQVEAREAYIGLLTTELSTVRGDIGELSAIHLSLEQDLGKLQDEYSNLAYWRQKNASGISQLTFIFSASTFREFLLRAQYIRQFSELRKIQLEAIKGVQETLGSQRRKLRSRERDKALILEKERKEKERLELLKKKRKQMIKELAKKEGVLRLELEKERRALKGLNILINNLVSRAKVVKERPRTGGVSISELSNRFQKSKKKIPWPVNGVIVSHFGRRRHPVLRGVEVDNQGVVIQTIAKEEVRTVFSGEVVTISYVPGMSNVVIVRHGDYYTLYARLGKVYVKNGQYLTQGDPVGVIFTDEKGASRLQFQVWKKAQKLNPEDWLSG